MLDKLVVKLMVFKMRLSDERGQDLAEYALLTGGVAIVVAVGVAFFGGKLNDWFNALAGKLPLT
jgi:Flp pilus assembly pilin Flp